MRLILTALIDFNNVNPLDQNASDKFRTNRRILDLVHPNALLDKIADANGGERPDPSDLRRNLYHATLKFNDTNFRKRYIQWIDSNYSHSMVNQRRIRSIEREVVVNWAKQFNQHHHHLTIVKLAPEITADSFDTELWMIGYGRRLDQNSFDFQNALSLEYHQAYHLSFYNLELDESRRLAANFDKTFNTYMPNADFRFFNEAPSYHLVNDCQPPRFNQDWLEAHRKQSASAVQDTIKKARSAYDSVSSRASSVADQNSRMITSLKAQASSALVGYSNADSKLSEQANVNASLSKANVSLRASLKSASSATSNSDRTVSKSAAHQIESLKSENSSLTSIFDYNQSVYQKQLSAITSSADAIKIKQASSASGSVSKDQAKMDLRRRNADLERQISSQSAEMSRQDKKSANQKATKSSPSELANSEPSTNEKTKPSRKAIYIPMIIVISIIIIILLIFVFPLFRF